jgi:hypothetical protein
VTANPGHSADPFRQFQYPTVPLGVSDEYRNTLLESSLKRRLGDDWDLG